ncbi:DUF2059 domain-containing protein [Azonexus sp. R2A61]|uniref:DUF2059 domain-containing protein n=1 Tax=Azonexus sp. R2A61 TaxID=2744443 RepID=UPI001F36321C|nr:DUF2059 domain-containing protein [Azonexus sp. R2A61]
MKTPKILLASLLFATTAAFAEPASEASIRQLLEVTQARELIDGMHTQIDAMTNAGIDQALAGKTPSDGEQQAIDNMKRKIGLLMRDELAWQRMEPIYLRLYRETLSEDEVVGMLDFYRTPAGQAMIRKMPLLMQKLMPELQGMMATMMPKMQKIQRDFLTDMKAARQ